MNNFDEIEFKYTDDYSVGLYDKKVCDILHSNTGALKEAYEKFVNPAEILIKNLKTNKINVLDICYGIGYNSKAFLHKYKDIEVKIDALEIKKELVLISPFITDKIEDNELKLFLLNKIIQNGADIKEVYSAVSRAELKSKSNYFSSFYSVFNGVFNDIRYELHPSESYNLFLHNIYYDYISYNNKRVEILNKYSKYNFKQKAVPISRLLNKK